MAKAALTIADGQRQNRWSDRLQNPYDNRTTFEVRRPSSSNLPSITITQPKRHRNVYPWSCRFHRSVAARASSMPHSDRTFSRLQQAGLEVHRHARLGTGLSRLDVYDWPLTQEPASRENPSLSLLNSLAMIAKEWLTQTTKSQPCSVY